MDRYHKWRRDGAAGGGAGGENFTGKRQVPNMRSSLPWRTKTGSREKHLWK